MNMNNVRQSRMSLGEREINRNAVWVSMECTEQMQNIFSPETVGV